MTTALKETGPSATANRVGRWRVNEAMTSSSVRHPNVVACLSYGSDGDNLYIVMDLAAAGDTDRTSPASMPST